MKGSEKQTKWAEEIKTKIETGFAAFTAHPVIDKATAYVLGIDNASFWIDEARYHTDNPIGLIMAFARDGIRIRGLGFGDLAKIDEQTGEITVSQR